LHSFVPQASLPKSISCGWGVHGGGERSAAATCRWSSAEKPNQSFPIRDLPAPTRVALRGRAVGAERYHPSTDTQTWTPPSSTAAYELITRQPRPRGSHEGMEARKGLDVPSPCEARLTKASNWRRRRKQIVGAQRLGPCLHGSEKTIHTSHCSYSM
jgi:hypothetical protein